MSCSPQSQGVFLAWGIKNDTRTISDNVLDQRTKNRVDTQAPQLCFNPAPLWRRWELQQTLWPQRQAKNTVTPKITDNLEIFIGSSAPRPDE